jgi:hypothetical protein
VWELLLGIKQGSEFVKINMKWGNKTKLIEP